MKSTPNRIPGENKITEVITVVSGLPRSGTSMMMQMLDAGGMPIVTDNIRKPDKDNPRGYQELEKAKKIKEDASWLEKCYGMAFKMVSALLYHLPKDKPYKVVFMKRNMQEILASQSAMLARLNKNGGGLSDDEMAQRFDKHLQDIQTWLSRQGNMDVIYVKYNDVLDHPYENSLRVSRFLNNWPNAEKMASVVEKSLHRQRKEEK